MQQSRELLTTIRNEHANKSLIFFNKARKQRKYQKNTEHKKSWKAKKLIF